MYTLLIYSIMLKIYLNDIYFNSLIHKHMPIIINLDVMMARRRMSLKLLSEKVNITPANLSILKTGKAKAIRFSTLEAICKVLECEPGDIIEYKSDYLIR